MVSAAPSGASDTSACASGGNATYPQGADLVYFAFVNYTTLGYGDVTPVKRWSLLGPMTAMNGVLMFGWSTAVIFEVLRTTLMASGEQRAQEKREWPK